MKQSFLIRLLPAACAVLVAPWAFAQAAPAAPGFRGGVRAAPQDPQPAPVARAESADRVQIRLAEVIAMLEEEQMSAESQARALAKLTEVMERLKRDRAAGQSPAAPRTGGMAGLGGGIARSAPAPTPQPAPAQAPRFARRAPVSVQGSDDPVVVRARVAEPSKPAQQEAIGVPMPPKPPKAPKAPKPPKAPKAPKTPDAPSAVDNPMLQLHELHAKVADQTARAHAEAAKAHEGALRAARGALSRHAETTKAHEEALEAHHEALRAKVEATRAEAKDKAVEKGAFEKLLRRTAGHEDEAAKEKAHAEAARSRDAKIKVERVRAAQPAPKTETRRRVVRDEEEGDDEAEIRATIDAMRAELREIRALLKQIGSRGHDEDEGHAENHAKDQVSAGEWRLFGANKAGQWSALEPKKPGKWSTFEAMEPGPAFEKKTLGEWRQLEAKKTDEPVRGFYLRSAK